MITSGSLVKLSTKKGSALRKKVEGSGCGI